MQKKQHCHNRSYSTDWLLLVNCGFTMDADKRWCKHEQCYDGIKNKDQHALKSH